VVHHPRNLGYGGALRTGLQEARKDVIFYTARDSHQPSAGVDGRVRQSRGG
jgi:hypothetical protein